MGLSCEILIQTSKERKHITGEPLKGIVKFHLDKDAVYKKVSLSLVEKGYCQWYENERSYSARHVQKVHQRRKVGKRFIFEGHETKVVRKIYLIDKHTDENTTLSAGSHEHPFEMIIPENIPSSVKTDIGEIKYYLVLKFKKPRIFSWSRNFKTKITIYPSVDSSITDKPLNFTLNKTLTKLFSANKHEINLQAELDKGYVIPSGERKISFVATNNSNVTFSVKTELISKTKYKDDFIVNNYKFDDPKTVRKEIVSYTMEAPGVPDNSEASMFNIIQVPPELCTIRHSRIITREYKIRVILKLPLPHINSSIEIPVFVGERLNKGNGDEGGETSETREDPPSYWESMSKGRIMINGAGAVTRPSRSIAFVRKRRAVAPQPRC